MDRRIAIGCDHGGFALKKELIPFIDSLGYETIDIGCYDENGRGTRFEYYKDGKLSYYYVSSDFDETGNESVQTYFNADGKLLASIKDGQFYDADGKVISEYQMDEILKKYK